MRRINIRFCGQIDATNCSLLFYTPMEFDTSKWVNAVAIAANSLLIGRLNSTSTWCWSRVSVCAKCGFVWLNQVLKATALSIIHLLIFILSLRTLFLFCCRCCSWRRISFTQDRFITVIYVNSPTPHHCFCSTVIFRVRFSRAWKPTKWALMLLKKKRKKMRVKIQNHGRYSARNMRRHLKQMAHEMFLVCVNRKCMWVVLMWRRMNGAAVGLSNERTRWNHWTVFGKIK